ncbi:MAG TPA: branched-chain amino acid ABC transporter substrate-binding protein [Aggregatilineales bacterium]|nr:branched-chain amino acid ABC transporter substrate-binding protein [Aggregatilineales bacterium]
MHRMNLLRITTVILAIAIAVPAYAASNSAVPERSSQGAQVIKIASQSPLSGPQSSLGTAISNGAKLAVQQLKKPIEDLGFQVQYVPYDDQATPDVGVSNAHNIVADASILAVIGHLNSGVAIPSSQVYVQDHLVMISPANTNPKVTSTDSTKETNNRVCGRDDIQGPVGAIYAAKTLKVKSVWVLDDKTAYGAGVAQAFKDEATKQGLNVVGFTETEEASNFDAILTPIAAAAPDLIYWGGIYDKGGPLFKQARAKGIKSQFMGADGLDSTDLPKLAGDAVIGTIFTTTAGPASMFPDAKQFITDYETAYNVKQVETYAPEAYAATQVAMNGILTAIKANGGKLPSRAQVAAAVRATSEFPTVIGKITFDAEGDPQIATYYTVKITSSDPTVYESTGKQVLDTVTAPSPLYAQMQASMQATMAAMAPGATMAATKAQ